MSNPSNLPEIWPLSVADARLSSEQVVTGSTPVGAIVSMINVWLSLKRARMIVQDLKEEYEGLAVHEDHIIEAMWNHPLYEDQMWLDVDWNDLDEVVDIHIGVAGGIII